MGFKAATIAPEVAHDRSRWGFDYSVMVWNWASVVLLFVISGCDSREPVPPQNEPVPPQKIATSPTVIKTRDDLEACLALFGGDNIETYNRARGLLKQTYPAPKWVIGELVRHLASDDPHSRWAAAYAMGVVIGSGRAHLDPLVAAVTTDDAANVRSQAVGSLGALLERGLHANNERVKESLLKALSDPDEDVRESAALVCVLLGPMPPEYSAAYLSLATDPSKYVRVAGFELLASSAKHRREVGQVLLTALGDSDPEIRDGAASAMSTYYERGNVIAIAALADALARESDSDVALGMAVVALTRLGYKHAELIAKRLKGATRTGTLGLLTALPGVRADDRARPYITPLAKSDDAEIRALAKEVLSMWGGR